MTQERAANLFVVQAACRCLHDNFGEAFEFLPSGWQAVGRGAAPRLDEAEFHDHPAQALPMLDELADCLALTSAATRPLVETLVNQSHALHWQQSYSQTDGFDPHYLDHYGWINLLSPDGPILCNDLRLTLGYWGAGLQYPRHWHAPEEIYCI